MFVASLFCFFFFFNDTATTEIYTLSLHDALPIYKMLCSVDLSRNWGMTMFDLWGWITGLFGPKAAVQVGRSEEHTSELQSRRDLVCRLLLEKKKKKKNIKIK